MPIYISYDIYIVKKRFWEAVGLLFPLEHLAVAGAFFSKR